MKPDESFETFVKNTIESLEKRGLFAASDKARADRTVVAVTPSSLPPVEQDEEESLRRPPRGWKPGGLEYETGQKPGHPPSPEKE